MFGRVKKWGRGSYHRFKLQRKYNKQIRFIERINRRFEDELPPLTREEEDAIRQFWLRYGYDDVPLQWHRFYYGKTGIHNPAFIPSPLFFLKIKPAMNNVAHGSVWSDKAYLDFFLRGIRAPQSVLRCINGRLLDENYQLITESTADAILSRYGPLVVKPSMDTDTGKGVKLLSEPISIRDIRKSHGRDFVVQIPLKQHEEMAKLNASSVNTIRVSTVLLDTEAYAMSAFVKVGQTGAFADNNGHDRYFIGIHADGSYADYAIDHDFNKYDHIPSGFDFAGRKVPSFDKVCEIACEAHKCVPRFGFAFWDVCVSQDGDPVIVEMNLKNPDAMVPQVAVGPFFGEYTERILEYVSRNG